MLAAEGIAARVVSMPCWDLFEEQPEDYRRKSLGPGTVKVAIEAAAREAGTAISARTAGDGGAFIGMHSFGASGPYKDVYKQFRHHRRSRGRRGARNCSRVQFRR